MACVVRDRACVEPELAYSTRTHTAVSSHHGTASGEEGLESALRVCLELRFSVTGSDTLSRFDSSEEQNQGKALE